MTKATIFDLDNTLTKPRSAITDDVVKLLMDISSDIYIVTGSDYKKVCEQISSWEYRSIFDGIFSNMGAILWNNDEIVSKVPDIDFGKSLLNDLNKAIDMYTRLKTGNHIENRGTMLNFSFVGRNATPSQRKDFNELDNEFHYRSNFVKFMMTLYPEYDYIIGGEISVDIVPKGMDKSQIFNNDVMSKYSEVIFVGDKIVDMGNDHGIAKYIHENNLGVSIQGSIDKIELITSLLK